jgi:hypothetical protein
VKQVSLVVTLNVLKVIWSKLQIIRLQTNPYVLS